MPIYNPNRGPLVKGIMVIAILAGISKIWQEGQNQYQEANPYAGMPDEFQTAMNDMGLQHSYEGTINTEIENMLIAFDVVDTADVNVITSNGKVYSVSATVTGKNWHSVCKPLADKIRELYPGTKVSFYEWRGSMLEIIYSE